MTKKQEIAKALRAAGLTFAASKKETQSFSDHGKDVEVLSDNYLNVRNRGFSPAIEMITYVVEIVTGCGGRPATPLDWFKTIDGRQVYAAPRDGFYF